jgi:DNA replication and repair protein RecF
MLLKHLSLTNYRNFIRLETEIPVNATILVGANAQGKTSLLEAISFLTGARPFYAANERQLINFLSLQEPRPFSRLVAKVEAQERTQRIEIRISIESNGETDRDRLKKEVLINGLTRRVRDLAGVINAVMFLPRDMEIIEGSPGNRRRFLGASLSQADPTYAEALAGYGKVLSQRNALLKHIQDRRNADNQLEFWDDQLCELGATLIRARSIALDELNQLATRVHQDLTQEVETLTLHYQPSYDPIRPTNGQLGLPIQAALDRTSVSLADVRVGLLAALRSERKNDILRGVTQIGPHRDDLRLQSNSIDLRFYGSRGQNRTAMLSTKLAEVAWLKARTGEWPILLFDEVLAELDPQRREDLLARVGQVQQSLLTAADLTMFSETFRQEASIWRIQSGTLSPWEL